MRPTHMMGADKNLSRNAKIGFAILIVGVILGMKSVEGAEIHWWLLAVSTAVVFVGWWGAFGDFSPSYWHLIGSKRHNSKP